MVLIIIDPVILRGLTDDMVSFEGYFASVSVLDKMFFVMEDLYSVKTIEDFRKLYNTSPKRRTILSAV